MSEPDKDALEIKEAEYSATMSECANALLRHVPEQGGPVSRSLLDDLIRTAYINGVIDAEDRCAATARNEMESQNN